MNRCRLRNAIRIGRLECLGIPRAITWVGGRILAEAPGTDVCTRRRNLPLRGLQTPGIACFDGSKNRREHLTTGTTAREHEYPLKVWRRREMT